jgi:hypothetical protein
MPPTDGGGGPGGAATVPPSAFNAAAASPNVELQPLRDAGGLSSSSAFGSVQVLDGREVLAQARADRRGGGGGGPSPPRSPLAGAASSGLWERLIPHPVWRVAARNLVLICIW